MSALRSNEQAAPRTPRPAQRQLHRAPVDGDLDDVVRVGPPHPCVPSSVHIRDGRLCER